MRMNTNTNSNAEHRQDIIISDRARLSISGVLDVQSFDEKSVILKTNNGMLAVDGEDLRISELSVDTGKIFVEGRIGGIVFFEPAEQKKKRGFMGR